MTDPKISMCITTYAGDIKLLEPLLHRLEAQTMAPHEVIVYTSGFDGLRLSPSIKMAGQAVPMHSIDSSKRTVQAIARNMCASVAGGDIVMFFDVDDIPHNQKIEATYRIFSDYNPDFFVHNYVDSDRFDAVTPFDLHDIPVRYDLVCSRASTNITCENYRIHHAHIAVKKHTMSLVRFREDMKYYRCEDGVFCQDLIRAGFSGAYSPLELVHYKT